MSSSSFIKHPVDISDSSVDELKTRDETAKHAETSTPDEKTWDNFDGYAEFVNHMAKHQVPIFAERFLLEDATLSVIGQGGTYVVRTAKLGKPVQSHKSRPFMLKASDEALRSGHPIESRSVAAGTAVVTKHIDFRNLKQRRAQGRVAASTFLKPYQTEAAILSHPDIRAHPAFPSLLGIGLEFSPDDVGEMPQFYPYMIMELGRQGSLEQSFRELWYRILQGLPGSPGQYNINTMYRKIALPWNWKATLARRICIGLCMLHKLGVVHGDVKLSNTLGLILETGMRPTDRGLELIMAGHQLTQIGDFGSSILLSKVQVGGKARLRSHTPPWNAPESTSEIDRDDLIKTDIYSYGLLFGRIMLQGASPFDTEFDAVSLLGCGLPKHDSAEIQRLRDSDTVDEHIYQSIEGTGFYSDEQLRVIRTILKRTLRTKAKDRVKTLDHIPEFLLEPRNAGKSVAWDETTDISLAALSLGDDLQANVEIHNLWDDNFIGPLSASDSMNVPNILDPAFAELRNERVLLREVLQDFRRHIAQNSSGKSHMARVHYQTAMCHFNGWGTQVDFGHCQTHLLKALSLGSIDALLRFQPVLDPPPQSSLHPIIWVETHPNLYNAMLVHFPDHVDMYKAVQLQNISADLFQMALSKARSNYIEYSDGKRLKIAGLLSVIMEQALSSGADSSNVLSRHDIYPDVHRPQENYADPPFTALCLAAAQGDMDSVLRLVAHLDKEPGLAENYLNRRIQSMTMDFRLVHVHISNQSAKDISGPLPHLQFKLEEQTHPLIMACSNGHSGVAVVLLAQGADPSQVDLAGRGPFHYLARFDPDEVEEVGDLLLEGQPDTLIDRVDNDGYSPLAFVLDTERNWVPGAGVAAAKFLLKKGASWYDKNNATDMTKTTFLKAVQSLNIQSMELIKDAAQSSISHRPQKDGGHESHTRVVLAGKHHLSAKSDTDNEVDFEQTIFQNQILYTIMALAEVPESKLVEREGSYGTTLARVIQFLIGSTHCMITPSMFAPVVHHIVKRGAARLAMTLAATLPSFDWSSQGIPLMDVTVALAGRNSPDMLVTLAQLGFNMNQVSKSKFDGNEFEYSFFHSAGYHRIPVDLVKYICHISSLDEQDTESDSPPSPDCMNAFDTAVIAGHFELADYLFHRGADISSPHLYSFKVKGAASPRVTVLGYVLTAVIPEVQNTPRRGEMLRYLLKLDVNLLGCPEWKQNIFHLVWRKWSLIGKDYFHPENELLAAFDEVMAVFEQLNDHFADASLLTARDVNGATPIHFAASSGNIRGLRRLLELGADATAKDNSGRSPMAYAALAIREALNYTVSGDPIPIQINPMEIIGPLQDLAIQSQMRLEQGRPDRVTRSVVLSRVLESIRKRRQAEEDGGETSFRTRREEPTEILVLVEIFIFLMRKYPEREPPSYEEDDIYSAD